MSKHFVCKFCGMITDNPIIVPQPEKDKEYRNFLKSSKPKAISYILDARYNHSITCPVCLNETRFWRSEPFPTDVPVAVRRRAVMSG